MKTVLTFAILILMMCTNVFADALLSKEITVYKNPDCGCCKKWIHYLEDHDYKVTMKNTRDVYGIKRQLGVPLNLAACHTAIIDGYVVEGHVTERDIQRLLLFRPKITGIAVPGMPVGSPGMERGNDHEAYNVMSFDNKGNTKVFVAH